MLHVLYHLNLKISLKIGNAAGMCPGEREHLGDSGIDGRIILSWIIRNWDVRVYWAELAQDTDR